MYMDFGSRGLTWVTSDGLIHVWESRKVAINQGARIKQPWKWRHKEGYRPYNWQLRKQIDIGTPKPPKQEAKAPRLREAKLAQPVSDTPQESKKPQKSFSARVAERWFEQRKRAKG